MDGQAFNFVLPCPCNFPLRVLPTGEGGGGGDFMTTHGRPCRIPWLLLTPALLNLRSAAFDCFRRLSSKHLSPLTLSLQSALGYLFSFPGVGPISHKVPCWPDFASLLYKLIVYTIGQGLDIPR